MRKLIISRGPQGVGKSTLCSKIGLEHNNLSSDNIRLLLSGPDMNSNGLWEISQERGGVVWSIFNQMTKERIERGETLYLDAMFLDSSDLEPYLSLAKDHHYEVVVADFTSVPLHIALEQNNKRIGIRHVGDTLIEKTYNSFKGSNIDLKKHSHVKVIKWTIEGGIDLMAKEISQWLTVPKHDLSSYKEIVHIGDLQGCFDVLAGSGGLLEKGLDPDNFYIFTGDLTDRGTENGKLMAWFRDQTKEKENVILVWGNHEDHLWRYATGQTPVSKEFELRTLPQLVVEGVSADDVHEILLKAVDIFVYSFNDFNVVVNHAGLTGLPPKDQNGVPMWHLLSRHQLSKGAGNYSDPVDAVFSKNQSDLAPSQQWIQVHGHRNKDTATLKYPLSINLEDGVEFGGNLRGATLSHSGWLAYERNNKIFSSWRQRFGGKKSLHIEKKAQGVDSMTDKKNDEVFSFDVRAPIPSWITDENSAPAKLEKETLEKMREHEGVMEKVLPDRPHISSLNFTKTVFFDKAWDDVVVKARGLFIDKENGDVVCRGYDKFFNIGERPETELSALSKTLKFPVVGFLKENGFLGNLGYDPRKDELMFASKSTTVSDFAQWFKEIFEATTTESVREDLKRYLRDAEASMVFEVIDPVRDPHMISYPMAKIVLLDVFHRSEDGKKLSYSELKKVGSVFELETKARMFEFKTMDALTGWISKAYKNLEYRFSGMDIEGVVFEDGLGFQTKCKMPHYSFWKTMRSTKDRIIRLKEKLIEIDHKLDKTTKKSSLSSQERENVESNLARTKKSDYHPLAVAFIEWCHTKSIEDLSKSIIELRDQFDKEVGIDPSWLKVKWDRFDPTEKEKIPSVTVIKTKNVPKF